MKTILSSDGVGVDGVKTVCCLNVLEMYSGKRIASEVGCIEIGARYSIDTFERFETFERISELREQNWIENLYLAPYLFCVSRKTELNTPWHAEINVSMKSFATSV